MKNIALSLLAGLLLLAGCSSTPPTKFEQALFNVQTNYVTTFVTRTNLITETNVVQVTQPSGVVVWQTNVVVQPQVVVTTNQVQQYTYSPGAGAQTIQGAATAGGNLFGVGGLTGTAVGLLLSLWGYIRSSKSQSTAAALAQVIETGRQLIQSLPNGAAYDQAWVTWMQAHQADAGVLSNVVRLLGSAVNNDAAQGAAAQLVALVQPAQASAGSPPPPPKP